MAGLRCCAEPALGKGRVDEDRAGLRARRNLTAGSGTLVCAPWAPCLRGRGGGGG